MNSLICGTANLSMIADATKKIGDITKKGCAMEPRTIKYQDPTTKKIKTAIGEIVNVYTLSKKRGMKLCSIKIGDNTPVVRWIKIKV